MEFHLIVQGEKTGPYPAAELRARVARGEVTPESLVWRPGMAQPQPLREVAELAPQPPPLPPLKLPVSGKVSIGAAALAFALLVPGILVARHSSNPADGGQTATLVAGMSLLTFGGLAGFIGAVLGLVALVQRGVARRTTAVTLAINLVILTAAIVVARGSRGALFGALFNRGDPVRVARRPIPVSASARTRKDFQPVLRAWYERNWLESYLKLGHRSPRWDEAGTNLIHAWIKLQVDYSLGTTEEALSPYSEQVLDAECDDPLLLYLCAQGQGSLAESTRLAESAHTAFIKWPKGPRYPAIVRFKVATSLARFSNRAPNRRPAVAGLEASALSQLKLSLQEGDFRREETRVFEEIVLNGANEDFFNRNSTAVCRMLDAPNALEPWLPSYANGMRQIAAAWGARGSGDANTVTSSGWQGFYTNLQAAGVSLQEAWKLDPRQPAISVAMMSVQLGIGASEPEGMRQWFDRAVQAELDYAPAYSSMRWGLRPRWHGSPEAMLAFGEACLASRRFDTDVPFHYLNALRDVVTDLGTEGDALYARPDVYRNLRAMYAGYWEARPDPLIRKRMVTDRAIAAYLAGELKDCRRDLESLQYQLLPEAVRRWPYDVSEMPLKVAALSTPAKTAVERGEQRRLSHDPEGALAQFRMAAEQAAGDEWAVRFITLRVRMLEMEAALARGGWVDYRPETDMLGWKTNNCQCRILADGTLEVEAKAGGYMVYSQARIGPDFEITGEVEFVTRPDGAVQGGVIVGHPGREWWSLRFLKGADNGDSIRLGHKFTSSSYNENLPLATREAFSLKSSSGKLVYTIGKFSARGSNLLWPVTDFAEPRDIEVGLGAYSTGDKSVVRYRNVKIRRLRPNDPLTSPK